MRKLTVILISLFAILLVGCSNNIGENTVNEQGKGTNEESLQKVSFVLDWTPNTNHTGIYVAQAEGFFEEEGLDVDILLPGEVGSTQLVATGNADFGVSYQEGLMMARHEGMPIVSIAAIIQNNTAGYASAAALDITEPKDFEGKVYGAAGSDIERAVLETIMKENGADIEKVEFTNIGDSDYFVAIEREIDFSLVFQGWTGIEGEIRDIDLNMVYLKDFADALNFYTPILATSEDLIEKDPELVEKFVRAATKGYEFAIENPTEAAAILLDAEQDLDETLVEKSQEWLSTQYKEDAAQFGVQELERWELVNDFMVEHDIIDAPLEVEQAFTNDFLANEEE